MMNDGDRSHEGGVVSNSVLVRQKLGDGDGVVSYRYVFRSAGGLFVCFSQFTTSGVADCLKVFRLVLLFCMVLFFLTVNMLTRLVMLTRHHVGSSCWLFRLVLSCLVLSCLT